MKLYYKDEYVKLIHGDCLEVMDKMIEKGIKFDLILTDPPYGTTACKWDAIIPFDEMWNRIDKIIKENSAVAIFGSEPFSSFLRTSNIKNYKYDWCWIKTKAGNFQQARKLPMKRHETISIFYKSYPTYNLWNLKPLDSPIKSSRKNKGSNLSHCVDKGEYYQKETGFHFSDLYFSNKRGKGYSFHPTREPIPLLEYLINTYTNKNDAVLDFTCGSGSTLIAAKNLNRKCYGIELEEKYCEIAKNRLIHISENLDK